MVNFQWSSSSNNKLLVNNRSRALGRSASLKSMLRTITMPGVTLASITTSEKRTLMLDSK